MPHLGLLVPSVGTWTVVTVQCLYNSYQSSLVAHKHVFLDVFAFCLGLARSLLNSLEKFGSTFSNDINLMWACSFECDLFSQPQLTSSPQRADLPGWLLELMRVRFLLEASKKGGEPLMEIPIKLGLASCFPAEKGE